MQKVWKTTKITLTIIVLLLTVLVIFNWEKVNRLHSVITLFDKERIVANFSNMADAFITKPIVKNGNASEFTYDPQKLPETFTYRDNENSVDEFLTRRSTTALLVIKDNKITFEDYYLGTKNTDKRISWSMAKSFVVMLFGMQVDAGKIDIEKPVSFYLPEMKGSGYEHVKVKHVLQMSSGVQWNEDYLDFNSDINKMGRMLAIGGSLDDMSTELKEGSTPGEIFHYVSIDTHVIGMIVRRVSGKSLVDLLQTNIWNKLGMENDADWITDSQGAAFALGGLNVSTKDYARFGQLMLNNGNWHGEQLVSENWISEAITPGADYLKPTETKLGYGYQIWLPTLAIPGEFFFVGVYGQYIYVNQQENIVIVKNSADKGFRDHLDSKQETIQFFRTVVDSFKTLTVSK